jgi:hypothetical protein
MYMQPDKWADVTKHPFGTRQKAICLPTNAATAPYMYLFLGDAMNNSQKRARARERLRFHHPIS